ncbi:MAG: histidine kinase dimerization/phosphoacceptor domain -containing protein [Novosphingobium sp.]
MEFFTPVRTEGASSLGMALVLSSATPLLLLNERLGVVAASESFCSAYGLRIEQVIGAKFLTLGDGEWDSPKLRSLLEATVVGSADVKAYEFVLKRKNKSDHILILHAHLLDQDSDCALQLVLAISDITAFRASELAVHTAGREKDALVQEKQVLMQELNHRVANSLQIIASILMQRVRSVQSEEARTHLREAHHRVMSIAQLQRHLAATTATEVHLNVYLTDLCASIAASMIADPATLTLNVIVDDSVMNPEQSVSLGLIVTELAINALKHAFPDATKPGNIDVRFKSNPTGWVMTVADNGMGMPKDQASAKPGLGTGIVNALAGQLSATVAVTGANPGTMVTVSCLTPSPAIA